jgi:hypothetical protein
MGFFDDGVRNLKTRTRRWTCSEFFQSKERTACARFVPKERPDREYRTRGFAAVGEPGVAVCLLPGTELVFDRDVECDHALGFFPNKKLRENVARFRQINLDNPYEHHDALEFPSGQVVLLTRLCNGQHATVLQLPAGAHPAEGAHDGETAPAVRRATFVE